LIMALLLVGCSSSQHAYKRIKTAHQEHITRIYQPAVQTQIIPKPKKHKTKFKSLVGMSCKYKKAVVVKLSKGWGEFYTCEKYKITKSYVVAAGAPGKTKTPRGTFKISWQVAKYDSKKYPSTNGRRNMDFSSFFHTGGVALHTGSIRGRSHGCVHLRKSDARYIYNNFNKGDMVIVKDK